MFTSPDKLRDVGLLVLRIGIGLMFVIHGFPKLKGGPAAWTELGKAMETFGISFVPVFWGFMAAISEFFGGILLALGAFFRPACLLLLSTMVVASAMHLQRGDGFAGASHAIKCAILFASLLLIGPGRLSAAMVCCKRGDGAKNG